MTLGNKGFNTDRDRTGVNKNLALIDATALGYKKDGTPAEQNVVHGSNILGGGWYFGTLENVYVSGSIGNGNGGYSGVVCQMRAVSIKNCIFDITLRADATGATDSALGIWVTGDTADRSVGTVENFIAITTTDKVANWSGDPIEFPVYANDAECYAGTAQTKFEAPWSRTEEGIFFGNLKVVGADALPVDLDGVTELCKEEGVNLTKITVGKDEISGTVTNILNASGEELKFTQSESGDNLVLTIAAESLGKLGYGETFLQILTNDSGARFTYNANVIVWEAYISNEAELIAFDTAFVATANNTAFPGWYRLDADIDLTNSTHIFGDRTTGNSNNGSNVIFTGTFDGQGHSITGIKTGNSGMFGYVERTGVIKNLAIIDALGQGDFCACILGGGWFLGTLENVYISGKLEKCSYSQPGVCPQFRAKSMKNVVFDVEKASDDANNVLLGIWVTGNYDNGEMASTALENVIVISSVGEAAISWAGSGAKPTYSLYTDAASCLAQEDFSKFDSSVWEKKADGVYFNGKKVIEGTQQA